MERKKKFSKYLELENIHEHPTAHLIEIAAVDEKFPIGIYGARTYSKAADKKSVEPGTNLRFGVATLKSIHERLEKTTPKTIHNFTGTKIGSDQNSHHLCKGQQLLWQRVCRQKLPQTAVFYISF